MGATSAFWVCSEPGPEVLIQSLFMSDSVRFPQNLVRKNE